MSVHLTAPGVYVEELPSGSRAIAGVSTSVTAFLGRALRGPMNEPVRVFGFGEFERAFGGLWARSDMSQAVRQFFQNGGGEALIVRLGRNTGASSAPLPGLGSLLVLDATAAARALPDFDHLRVTLAHGAGPGDVDLTVQAEDDADTVLVDAAGSFAYTVGIDLASGTVAADLAAAVTPTTTPINLATLVGAAPAARPAAGAATSSGAPAARHRILFGAAQSVTLRARNAGAWGDAIRIDIDHAVDDSAPPGSFNLTARLTDGSGGTLLTESWFNVSLEPGTPRSLADLLAQRSELVWFGTTPPPFTRPNETGSTPIALATGSDGDALTITEYQGSAATGDGYHALERADLVNLLAVPFPATPDVIDDDARAAFWAEVMPWCVEHRAFAIVDPPVAWTTFDAAQADSRGFADSVRSTNGAIYFPRIRTADPLQQNRLRDFAPSGAVAGVYARTDSTRGIWKAPAGTDAVVAGALGLAVDLTDAEQGVLNRIGVNCLRTFPVHGRVVWGARTLRGADRAASEWKYVPVRRLALYLQESLFRGTRWAVFEPNDEPLWAQLRLDIGAFMHRLFRQGAFAGATPRDAYFVKCDADTTPQDDVDRGIVNVIVGFAPLEPAEFVIIKVQQLAGNPAE